MGNKIGRQVAQGVKNADPATLLEAFGQGVDLRDLHIGIEHGPSGTVYNKVAVPWAGGLYTQIGNQWRKVGGRPGAISGDALEARYPAIAEVWRNFEQAQQNREADPGDFAGLVADLERVASDLPEISERTKLDDDEGVTDRALKVRRKTQEGSLGELAQPGESEVAQQFASDGGQPVGE